MSDAAPNTSVSLNPINAPIGTTGTGKALSATDAKGNPVPVPPDLNWSSSDPTVLNVVTNADGTGTFTPLALGTAAITVVSASSKATSLSQPVQVIPGAPANLVVQISFG